MTLFDTYLSKDGDICTDRLVNVDGDVIGPNLLGQSTGSLLRLARRVRRTHVTGREQLPAMERYTCSH